MQSNKNEDNRQKSTNINWYPGHMAKTKRLILEKLDLIDVVVEILDARIPNSSHVKDLDNIIKSKPRIIVMTKIDLCDIEETKKWVKYYECHGVIVVPMNLSSNISLNNLQQAIDSLMSNSNAIRQKKGMIERRPRVLIVGIPNVGKSTFINRLVGRKVTKVGNVPGVTKSLEWIRVSDRFELLDTPGILWPKFDNEVIALNLAALTAIKEEVLPLYDVTEYILKTLEQYYPHILKECYNIDYVSDVFTETLEMIGKKRGCLVRGGEVDYDKVITIIMNEIKNGKIKGITFDRFNEVVDER